jgi:phosphoribosyl 1,2-cyclic phosphodiesterase
MSAHSKKARPFTVEDFFMRAIALQSGSSGNAVYVESQGAAVIVDAGLSGKQVQIRADAAGIDLSRVQGILLSHDHIDHSRAAGILHRRHGWPVYGTRPTIEAACRYHNLGVLRDVRFFRRGESFQVGPLTIETIATPHDAADGCVFVIDDGQRRVGVMTDLGHVFPGLADVVATLDGVFLESNYDPDMLANGGYPPHLKKRITGPRGHISNAESAEVLAASRAKGRLKWAALSHLSQENNTPEIAHATHRRILGDAFPLYLTSRHTASPLILCDNPAHF